MTSEKLYHKIGEACRRLDIQPYVLRYWETEFSALAPSKSKSGQRVYSEKDLRIIARIKELLYEEGYTIAGAKKKLEGELKAGSGELPERLGRAAGPQAESSAEKGAEEKSEGDAAAPTQEVARLRQGIGEALDEARLILDLLDKGGARG